MSAVSVHLLEEHALHTLLDLTAPHKPDRDRRVAATAILRYTQSLREHRLRLARLKLADPDDLDDPQPAAAHVAPPAPEPPYTDIDADTAEPEVDVHQHLPVELAEPNSEPVLLSPSLADADIAIATVAPPELICAPPTFDPHTGLPICSPRLPDYAPAPPPTHAFPAPAPPSHRAVAA